MSRFDRVIDRRNSCSRKWDSHEAMGYRSDILPLWVADMDFETLPEITAAIVARAQGGVYGYPLLEPGTTLAIKHWMKRRFDWEIEEQWIVHTPGVVFAFHLAVQLFTKEGDAVMIQSPVYPPFGKAAVVNGRKLVDLPLGLVDGQYTMDFDAFEATIVEHHVTMFIFCNPHNPIGKVYTKEEIKRIGDICLAHQVLVISDEIHEDFVYSGYQHLPFTKVDRRFADNVIVCTAPSKTFNLAGMQFSNIIIENETLRKQFQQGIEKLGLHMNSTFGSLACKLAYEHGDVYVDELVAHIQHNLAFVRQFLKEHMPTVHIIEPQSLYLVWLDFSALGMNGKELEQFMRNEANVWLNEGYTFGAEGFERINVACPRETLEAALLRIRDAVDRLQLVHG